MKNYEDTKKKYFEIVKDSYIISTLLIIDYIVGYELGDKEQDAVNLIHDIYISTDMTSIDKIANTVVNNMEDVHLDSYDFTKKYEEDLFDC